MCHSNHLKMGGPRSERCCKRYSHQWPQILFNKPFLYQSVTNNVVLAMSCRLANAIDLCESAVQLDGNQLIRLLSVLLLALQRCSSKIAFLMSWVWMLYLWHGRSLSNNCCASLLQGCGFHSSFNTIVKLTFDIEYIVCEVILQTVAVMQTIRDNLWNCCSEHAQHIPWLVCWIR